VSGIITSPSGIAPHAKIVALKMCNSCGYCNESDSIAAIDWILSNKEKYPIKIINMSFGEGRYSSYCNNEEGIEHVRYEITKAAIDRGITLFAASGNNGYTDGIAIPACLSTVISVGSVYDANIGNVSNCTENTGTGCDTTCIKTCPDSSTEDKVVCNSNVSSSLNLLAPGKKITSSCVGGATCEKSGTSMASPHAAALAALMLQKNPALSPAQIKNLMVNNGKWITDTRVNLPFKRIDAVATLNAITLSASPSPYNFGAVEAGDYSALQTFTVSNKNSTAMTIGTVALYPLNEFEYSARGIESDLVWQHRRHDVARNRPNHLLQ